MLHVLKQCIPQNLKNIYHLVQAIVANVFYGFPSRKLRIIAVTGTDGKTTTAQMIAHTLRHAGHKVAMASTVNFCIGDKHWINASKMTTLTFFQLQKFLRDALRAQCEYVVLEISSHSLDQHRAWGMRPEVAVVTNITREHLDYHKTMENYRRAKRKLFEISKQLVINAEMENPDEFALGGKSTIFYTTKKETIAIDTRKEVKYLLTNDLHVTRDGSDFTINTIPFHLNLLGKFNIENALAAIGALEFVGVSLSKTSEALACFDGVPGRMELIPNDRNLSIIIDYAVTPHALSKLYELLDTLGKPGNKIIAVFGACGDRDRGKRPMMGEIVSRVADIVILTNEDPYYEDPERILDEVEVGVKGKRKGETLYRIFDRREAIAQALKIAKEGDVIAITGKGAEETMKIKDEMIPWNDKKVVLEELEKLG